MQGARAAEVYGSETADRATQAMDVLIVEDNDALGRIWESHLVRQGMHVTRVQSADDAIAEIGARPVDVIVLNLVLKSGSAFAISDYAAYRRPSAKVIFVTNTTFFSDGSIFRHSANACAFLRSSTPPDDLAALVAHYGAA